jgi:signal transduction histidine kinase
MWKTLKIYALTWVLALGASSAVAKNMVLERAVFEDASAEMSLAEVKNATFSPASEVINEGFSRSALWVRLSINVPAEAGPLVIRLRPTLADEATLYYPGASPFSHELALQLNARSAQKQTLLSLQPGPQTLYLRVASIGVLMLKAELLTVDESVQQDLSEQRQLGAVLASYALLSLALLMLLLKQPEKLILVFFLHMAVCLLLYLQVFDLTADLMPGSWALTTSQTVSRFLGLANFLSFALVMQALLGLLKRPRLQRLGSLAVLVAVLLLAFFAFGIQRLALQLGATVGALLTLMLVTVQLYLLYRFCVQRTYPLRVRICYSLIVGAFIGLVCQSMLQVLEVIEGGDFLLRVQAWRGLFLPLALASYLWHGNWETAQALNQVQIDRALATALGEAQTERLATQSQFMAMLMHELKTPLYIIQLAVAAINRGPSADRSDLKRLDNIARAADDMNFILDRCVQADQLDQNADPCLKSPVSLQTLLSEVRPISGSERIAWSGITEAVVSTDYQYARIILINLITNALKYSPPDSQVQVNVQADATSTAPSVMIRVVNAIGSTGHPDPQKVFTRYYRAESAKKETGAGLGLWLAQSIAVKLGTELRCSHNNELVHFEFSLELN